MKPWRCDPYLWVHLAGLATVPLWIDLCLLGLAVGHPTLPALELVTLIALGVLPVLAMQLWRPFYIFSLPGLVLRPRVLQEDRRRVLRQLRSWRVRLGALLVPLPLVWVLVQLYPLAFLARDFTPFGDWGRLGGWAIAVLGFALANLFLQVPVAVLQVLATPDRRLMGLAPYPADRTAQDFMAVGIPLGRILPDVGGGAVPEPEFVSGEPEAAGAIAAASPAEAVATVPEVAQPTLGNPSIAEPVTAPESGGLSHPEMEPAEDDIAVAPSSGTEAAPDPLGVLATPVAAAQSRPYRQDRRS